jgi:hypothetical protein
LYARTGTGGTRRTATAAAGVVSQEQQQGSGSKGSSVANWHGCYDACTHSSSQTCVADDGQLCFGSALNAVHAPWPLFGWQTCTAGSNRLCGSWAQFQAQSRLPSL